MIIESFWELPQSAVGLRVSEAILQHWRKGVYSYLDRPRPGYGLMLMVKGTIRFVSDADALSAATGDLVFLPATQNANSPDRNSLVCAEIVLAAPGRAVSIKASVLKADSRLIIVKNICSFSEFSEIKSGVR